MNRPAYIGLALIAAATIMSQIVLSRIFSVILMYHMSLVCVSAAMLGMTVGAFFVGWRSDSYKADRILSSCTFHSFYFGITTIISVLVCIYVPYEFNSFDFLDIVNMVLWNVLVSIPFVFSGIIVCAMLTRYPSNIGKLYTADLAGASLGCILVVFLLNHLDAISAMFFIAAMGFFAAFFFSKENKKIKSSAASMLFTIGLVVFAMLNSQFKMAKIGYVLGKPHDESRIEHEYWNIFSHVIIDKPVDLVWYWGPGRSAELTAKGRTKSVYMDTRAGTHMVEFNGDWNSVRWLQADVTNVVHDFRPEGSVLVLGCGVGRDVLSALIESKGNREVDGVDINPVMIDVITKQEKDFSGNLASLPHVKFHNDEARSWTERTKKRFDVITVPLVDTSAASAAGAYALTENSLYTVEAIELFLNKLKPGGMLSISRWWFKGKMGETQRLLHMAAVALRNLGVSEPRKHLMIFKGQNIATLLISPTPLNESDLNLINPVSSQRGYDVLLSPDQSFDSDLVAAIEDENWAEHNNHSESLDLSASTDDKPFYFHILKFSQVFNYLELRDINGKYGTANYDVFAILLLGVLILGLLIISAIVLIATFFQATYKKGKLVSKNSLLAMTYFSLIGLGFMFFESSQVQRLNVFLGNPVYALSVVLFSLLLFSSFGSYFASTYIAKSKELPINKISLALITVLFLLATCSPVITKNFADASEFIRILVALLLITPASLLMGVYFPYGMDQIMKKKNISANMCWVANGMTSTTAAVVSIAFSISYGLSFTFWLAFICYALVWILALTLKRLSPSAAS